ncbi:MAG: 5'-methylthioadenosine/adenosylhomocysteine nucleosidase [Mogibacterium sp.]|nr:5'-methylthioadenosine/adenosylhomocysteine nucleosidase [Mogibacterium sp.]
MEDNIRRAADRILGAAGAVAGAAASAAGATRRPIGILCAMDIEIADLLESLENAQVTERAGYRFSCGTIGGQPVVLVRCGVGKVNAARGTQMLIDLFEPEAILNSGIAGGTAEGLQVGDVVIGTDLVQHDFDVTAFGHAKGFLCTDEPDDKPTVFTADPALVDGLAAASQKLPAGTRRIHRGRLASGDQVIASTETNAEIAGLFGAMAAETESAAIAQTASYAGVPFAVIRVISDLADGTAPESYETFEIESADFSAAVIQEFLAALGK